MAVTKVKLFIKMGVGLLSLTAALVAYTVFKPNINPQALKEEAEKNIQNTKNTFEGAGKVFR